MTTTKHQHRAKSSRDLAFAGPVAQPENQSAHGNIVRIDTFGVWLGPVESYSEAAARADRHQEGQVAHGGGSSAVWIACQGDGVAVHADTDTSTAELWQAGDPIWPPSGRSAGAVRW